ncbi:MAG: transcription antitermination factor NusB [Clostridia bacterium]|nr:transcription antitermination factor NusB [Clostridia bacterium]
MNRKTERENTFILVFEEIFSDNQSAEELIDIASTEANLEMSVYIKDLFLKVVENKELIDNKIKKYCKKWTIARIPKTSLAIIRMAVAEILFTENISVSITINSAVELSKKYSAEDDYKFVNGILSSIVKENENG